MAPSDNAAIPAAPAAEEALINGFRFDDVLKASFVTYFRTFGFIFSAALIIPLPSLLAQFAYPLFNAFEKLRIGNAVIVWMVDTLFYHLLIAITLHAVVNDLRGQRVKVGIVIARGLTAFLPCLLTGLVVVFGFALGLVLLVIPGVIWILGQIAAIPVCVIEGAGLKASLRRSWALTRGHRLPILGLLVVVAGINYGADRAFSWILEAAVIEDVDDVLWALAHHAFLALTTCLLIAMVGCIYVKLVAAEDVAQATERVAPPD